MADEDDISVWDEADLADVERVMAHKPAPGGQGVAVPASQFARAADLDGKQPIGAETVAAAATTDIGAVDAAGITITGDETITSLGNAKPGTAKTLYFTGNATVEHGASIALPDAVDFVSRDGDVLQLMAYGSEAATVWRAVVSPGSVRVSPGQPTMTVASGIEDGSTFIKSGNNLVQGPSAALIESIPGLAAATETWRDEAEDFAEQTAADVVVTDENVAITDVNRSQTADDVIAAKIARDQAQAAAAVWGYAKMYFSKAEALAALPSLEDDQAILVSPDESRGGGTIRYIVSGGALVFNADLSKFERLMELDLRKPRKLWAKIFRMMSNVDRVHWVSTGDSLASRKFQQIVLNLDRMLGANSSTADNPAGNNTGTQGGDQLYPSDLVNAGAISSTYGIVPTGSYHNVNDGGSVTWTYSGVSPAYSRVRVYYVKEPGAGTLNLVVNSVTVASGNANHGTTELGILEYDLGFTQSNLATITSATGATVKVIGLTKFHDDRRGLVKHHLLAAGGINVAGMMQTAASRLIYQQLLTAMTPDIITLEMDDEYTAPAFTDALETMLDIWDAAAPYADKLLIGSTPRAAGDEDKRLANLHLREVAHRRDTSYLYFDSYSLMGSYSDMTAIFGADDGVHPNVAAQGFAAEMLWNHLGLNANMGRLYRAIYTPNVPSSFYKALEVRSNINPFTLDGDSGGVEWYFSYDRVLSFKNLAGIKVAQFSTNTTLAPNVLPMGWDFGFDGKRKLKFVTDVPNENSLVQFLDSDMDTGFLGLQVSGVRHYGHTLAELSALSPVQHQGETKFCLDAAGGKCLVISDGSAWKRIVTTDLS